jgi:ribosomal protein S27E
MSELNKPHTNTEIECPGCKAITVVGHLEWTALSCPNCETFYDLAPWLIKSRAAK